MNIQEKRNKLDTLKKQTIELIKKGKRESLIMANITIIESLEYQLGIKNGVQTERIFNGY